MTICYVGMYKILTQTSTSPGQIGSPHNNLHSWVLFSELATKQIEVMVNFGWYLVSGRPSEQTIRHDILVARVSLDTFRS